MIVAACVAGWLLLGWLTMLVFACLSKEGWQDEDTFMVIACWLLWPILAAMMVLYHAGPCLKRLLP